MKNLLDWVESFIPGHFAVTIVEKERARTFVAAQLLVGLGMAIISLVIELLLHNPIDSVLYLFTGTFLVFMAFMLRFFKSNATYVNLILCGLYISWAVYVHYSGGFVSDRIYGLALLLVIAINFCTKLYQIIWSVLIAIYVIISYAIHLENNAGNDALIARFTNVFIFYVIILAILWINNYLKSRRNRHFLEANTRLKKLNKQKDDLMTVVAHDLKSPLQKILGLTNLMKYESLTEDQAQICKRIGHTAEEGEQLIADLVEATHFQSVISFDKLDVNKTVYEVIRSFEPVAKEKNIKLKLNGNVGLPLKTSKHHFIRILDNLVSNAIKFSPIGSQAIVRFGETDSSVWLEVQDEGPGFTQEDQKLMFQMFQKLSARPTAGESSTGLGLSIIRSFTNILHGEIDYVTELKKGTSFRLILPKKIEAKRKIIEKREVTNLV